MATSIAFDIIARDRASATFNKVGQSASSSSGALRKFGTAAKAGALAVVGLAAAAGKMAFDAIGAASDLNEVLSKTNQIFGSRQGAALAKWSEGTAKALGMSRAVALDAASTFGVMGKAAGKSGADLRKFATENTQLAADLASFNNSTPEEAITAIGAALRGESEPIRRFGVLLDDATLRNEALKMGLIETTTQALTPQQKALAAHAQIMKQTSDAQGDFERTSGGLANQQRILKAQLADVQAEIGQKLLPVAIKLATFANANLIPAIERLWSWLEQKLGPALRKVGAWIQTELIPPLKTLAERVMSGARKAFDQLKGSGDEFRNVLKFVGEVITNVVIPAIGWLAEKVLPILGVQLKMSLKILSAIVDVARWVGEKLKVAFNKAAEALSPLISRLQTAFSWMQKLQGNTVIQGGPAKGPIPEQFHTGGNTGSGAGTPEPPNSHQRSLVTSPRAASGRTASTGMDYRALADAIVSALRDGTPLVQLSDAGQGGYLRGAVYS